MILVHLTKTWEKEQLEDSLQTEQTDQVEVPEQAEVLEQTEEPQQAVIVGLVLSLAKHDKHLS